MSVPLILLLYALYAAVKINPERHRQCISKFLFQQNRPLTSKLAGLEADDLPDIVLAPVCLGWCAFVLIPCDEEMHRLKAYL